MAFNKRILTRLYTIGVVSNRNFTRYAYATDDPKAATQAAGYFNDVSNVLKVNDLIDVVADHAKAGDVFTLKVTAVVPNGEVKVALLNDARAPSKA